MFGVFRTKLQRQNQGSLGGVDSYSNLFEIDAKYFNYFKDEGRNSENFRNAAKWKKININRNQSCKFLVGKVKTRSFGCLAPNLW